MIDIERLVQIDLAPVFDLDPALQDEILDRIDAEIALQGWDQDDITDQQASYIALLTTKSFIPRLLLYFAQQLRKARGGQAEAEYQDAIEFLRALQKELDKRMTDAQVELGGITSPDVAAWPGVGVLPWG